MIAVESFDLKLIVAYNERSSFVVGICNILDVKALLSANTIIYVKTIIIIFLIYINCIIFRLTMYYFSNVIIYSLL